MKGKMMLDFPPNLEDGELWLPSDVFQEIVSTDFTVPNCHNASNVLLNAHPNDEVPQGHPVTNDDLISTSSYIYGNWIPMLPYYPYESWDSYFQLVPAPFQIDNQVNEQVRGATMISEGQQNLSKAIDQEISGKEEKVDCFVGKSKGTGVFFPLVKPSDHEDAPKSVEEKKVVDLDHDQAVISNGKSKKSWKNGQGSQQKYAGKK